MSEQHVNSAQTHSLCISTHKKSNPSETLHQNLTCISQEIKEGPTAIVTGLFSPGDSACAFPTFSSQFSSVRD